MDVNKTQAVIYMYDTLLNGNGISSKEVVEKFGITKRTFFNYINEIKAFCCNFYKNKEVEYDRKTECYYLK